MVKKMDGGCLEYSMRARKASNDAFLLPNHGHGDVFPHCSCMHAFCTKKIPSASAAVVIHRIRICDLE